MGHWRFNPLVFAALCQLWTALEASACGGGDGFFHYELYKGAEIVVRARPLKLEPIFGEPEAPFWKVRQIGAVLDVEVEETLRGEHLAQRKFLFLPRGLGRIPRNLEEVRHLMNLDWDPPKLDSIGIIGASRATHSALQTPIILQPNCDFAFVMRDEETHLLYLRSAGVIPGRAND